MWDLIVSVPDCLVTFQYIASRRYIVPVNTGIPFSKINTNLHCVVG